MKAGVECNHPPGDNRKLFQFYASENIFPVEYPPEQKQIENQVKEEFVGRITAAVWPLLSIFAFSASAIAAQDDYYAGYSIVSVDGDMPIRTVIVKRVSQDFVSYRGFQFDCTNQALSQSGFYNAPDLALGELAKVTPSSGNYTFMTDRARAKACDIESSQTLGGLNQPQPQGPS